MESSTQSSIPERFDPATMAGELTEAEHLGRYLWAGQFARGKRVLDAGCGTAYGSAILSREGAASVVGVDVAPAVIEAARGEVGDEVELIVGDISSLEFDDDSFDVVACFEVIEHVENPEPVVRELRRVLAPGGILIASSPNRESYVPGNPHHVREFLPDEFRALLGAAFTHVGLWRQQGWIGVGVFDDPTMSVEAADLDQQVRVFKAAGAEPGSETYTLAIASDRALPDADPALALTGLVEVRHWADLYAEQQEILHRQHEHLTNVERNLLELAALRAQLRESEQRLARLAE